MTSSFNIVRVLVKHLSPVRHHIYRHSKSYINFIIVFVFTSYFRGLSNHKLQLILIMAPLGSRTFSMGGRGRGYQRLALQRDRPYASPYREATDTELISGKAAKKSIQGGDAESGGVARDDVSEISDISAWSVPTKVKQLLQIDGGSENQEPAGTSKVSF